MLYSINSQKPIEQVIERIKQACERHKFGVLHTYNLKEKLKEKGIEFSPRCDILEVCNPQQAFKVLSKNLAISTALPCRISVYEAGGEVILSTIKPTALLGLFPNPELLPVAREVEDAMVKIMQEAA
jgi:uncharacterized protein (DUF302 family)